MTGSINKKAMLSQRWPRDAPYIFMPSTILKVPGYAHGHYSRNC